MARELARAGVRLAKTAAGSATPRAVAGASRPHAIAGSSSPRAVGGAPHPRAIAGSATPRAVAGAPQPCTVAGDLVGVLLPRPSWPPLRVPAGLPLRRHVTGLPLPRLVAGLPQHRTVAGRPLHRGLHTVVVVVDADVDSSTAERLTKVVKEELAVIRSDKLSPEAQAARDALSQEKEKLEAEAKKVLCEARKELLEKKNTQRMLTQVHSSVKRLEAGHAPPQILVAFGRLASIQRDVKDIKSESEKARKKLEDEKLWLFVLRDRCLEKLPKPVVACYESAREVWGTVVDLYPLVVLIFLLSSYPPDQLFGIGLEGHDVYLEQVKQRLKKLHDLHVDKKKQRALAEGPDAAVSVRACARNRSAESIWACVKGRFSKIPLAPPAPAVVVPQSVAESAQGGADVPLTASQEGCKKQGIAPPTQDSKEAGRKGPASVSPQPPTQASKEVCKDGSSLVSPPTQDIKEVSKESRASVVPPPSQDSQ